MASFIKNTEILEENYKVEDLLDFSNEVNRLNNLINSIPYSSLIGYIGKFGSGKSTTIYQLQKKYKSEGKTKWFEFDAWKYPERKDLWEGFVLDVADQIGDRKRIENKIDGKQHDDKKALIQTISSIPMLSAISGANHFFESSPIKRVFDIQKLLVEMFSSIKEKDIFIVLEDIDRSGDTGSYFLETLRQFIKNNLLDKKITIIIPIGIEIYNIDDKCRSSYQKVLDYTLFFEPRGINFNKFIEELFDPISFPDSFEESQNTKRPVIWKEHLIDWFYIVNKEGLTIREIKEIIRIANLHYDFLLNKEYNPDPRILLSFASLQKIKSEGGKAWIDLIESENPISQRCPIYVYIQAVGSNKLVSSYAKTHTLSKVFITKEKKFNIPKYINHTLNRDDIGYYLSDFYLIPFGKTIKQ